jgi:hypothetical protein
LVSLDYIKGLVNVPRILPPNPDTTMKSAAFHSIFYLH